MTLSTFDESTLLLFAVELKRDVGLVRYVGPVALATGIGQLVFTTAGLARR